MKLWIIGAGGMLGTALAELCRMRAIEAHLSSHAEADVTDFLGLLTCGKEICPTHIVNCAAYTNVDRAEQEPDEAFAVNALGAGYVAQVAAALSARLVSVSTDYVFDGQASRPLREEDACSPINAYGRSKWEGEKQVVQYCPQACIMRTSWLFGGKGKNFISFLLQWIQEKEEFSVVSDQCGKPTYCYDAAEAVLSLLDQAGLFHFAGKEAVSRYDVAVQLWNLALAKGLPVKCQKITAVPSSDFPTPAPRPSYSVLDTAKYEKITQRQPRALGAVLNALLNHEI